jgi:hypothetical protein
MYDSLFYDREELTDNDEQATPGPVHDRVYMRPEYIGNQSVSYAEHTASVAHHRGNMVGTTIPQCQQQQQQQQQQPLTHTPVSPPLEQLFANFSNKSQQQQQPVSPPREQLFANFYNKSQQQQQPVSPPLEQLFANFYNKPQQPPQKQQQQTPASYHVDTPLPPRLPETPSVLAQQHAQHVMRPRATTSFKAALTTSVPRVVPHRVQQPPAIPSSPHGSVTTPPPLQKSSVSPDKNSASHASRDSDLSAALDACCSDDINDVAIISAYIRVAQTEISALQRVLDLHVDDPNAPLLRDDYRGVLTRRLLTHVVRRISQKK